MPKHDTMMPAERIERAILLIRGEKVILDRDLADLYGVSTTNLNKAVTRNLDRFPADFMFQLSRQEFNNLMFQFGTSSWGGTRKLPRAFTEQGVAMLSSILNSKRAVLINVEIMRVFVRLRRILSSHKEISRKIEELEQRIDGHDEDIHGLVSALKQLISPPVKDPNLIGFRLEPKKGDNSTTKNQRRTAKKRGMDQLVKGGS